MGQAATEVGVHLPYRAGLRRTGRTKMNQSDLSRCAQEELTIGEQIRAGHPQEFGLRLGAQDWLKEEAMLLLSQRGVVGQEQKG